MLPVTKLEDLCSTRLENLVYPITLAKFVLNRSYLNYLLSEVEKVSRVEDLKIPPIFDTSQESCRFCKNANNNNPSIQLCRRHSSIQRIKKATKLLKDEQSGFYMIQNEILSLTSRGLSMISYCPHTKLIQGELSLAKIKKISTFCTHAITELDIVDKEIKKFDSSILYEKNLQCWFNETFYLVLISNVAQPEVLLKPTK